MHTIDMILLTLYFIGAVCGVYNLIKHAPYFKERFKSGVVSAFMLAMLFFWAHTHSRWLLLFGLGSARL